MYKKILALIFLSIVLFSCGLKPFSPEYDYIKIERDNVELDSLGNRKILIYNGADILHAADNTERLNVKINNKSLGQLWGYEYVIVELDSGHYSIDLHHKDFVNIRSSHELKINDTIKVIRVEPTVFSNKVTITNELPKRFKELYRIAKNRTKQ